MGISERKEREKEEMRKLIIDAAFEMFLKEGYAGTSLRLIAKKIEYSPGTIYLYYKDKDTLFFDIQSRCFEDMIVEYKKVDEIKDPLQRLKEIGNTYMRMNTGNPHFFNLKFLHDSPLAELKRKDRWEKHGNGVGFFKSIVSECIALKLIAFSESELQPICMEMFCLVHGLTTMFVNRSYEAFDLTEAEAKIYIYDVWSKYLKRIEM